MSVLGSRINTLGEIYGALDVKTEEAVAVKVERVAKPGNLVHEEEILKALQRTLSFDVQTGISALLTPFFKRTPGFLTSLTTNSINSLN